MYHCELLVSLLGKYCTAWFHMCLYYMRFGPVLDRVKNYAIWVLFHHTKDPYSCSSSPSPLFLFRLGISHLAHFSGPNSLFPYWPLVFAITFAATPYFRVDSLFGYQSAVASTYLAHHGLGQKATIHQPVDYDCRRLIHKYEKVPRIEEICDGDAVK